MFEHRIAVLLTLAIVLFPTTIDAQSSPASRYRAAEEILKRHTPFDFLHDDSPEAINALKATWAAEADITMQFLAENQTADPEKLHSILCKLEVTPTDCQVAYRGGQSDVLRLGPNLFAVAQFGGEVGTVFIAGLRGGKPALLWSIGDATPQARDPRGFVAAWQAERAGEACRSEARKHPPGTCGPLYATLGILPPDSEGRPRFYIDAGYAQSMGATAGHQASVWWWDGDQARLLWIDWYDVMIDQQEEDGFAGGILSFVQKEEFRTFDACGNCEGRQMQRRLRITPTGVEDLGKQSLTPELDIIDELFWRLARHKPIADIAAPEVAQLLAPQFKAAQGESKTDANSFSAGMLDSTFVTHHGSVEQVCFVADGDIGRIDFTIQAAAPGHGMKITNAVQPSGNYEACEQPSKH